MPNVAAVIDIAAGDQQKSDQTNETIRNRADVKCIHDTTSCGVRAALAASCGQPTELKMAKRTSKRNGVVTIKQFDSLELMRDDMRKRNNIWCERPHGQSYWRDANGSHGYELKNFNGYYVQWVG